MGTLGALESRADEPIALGPPLGVECQLGQLGELIEAVARQPASGWPSSRVAALARSRTAAIKPGSSSRAPDGSGRAVSSVVPIRSPSRSRAAPLSRASRSRSPMSAGKSSELARRERLREAAASARRARHRPPRRGRPRRAARRPTDRAIGLEDEALARGALPGRRAARLRSGKLARAGQLSPATRRARARRVPRAARAARADGGQHPPVVVGREALVVIAAPEVVRRTDVPAFGQALEDLAERLELVEHRPRRRWRRAPGAPGTDGAACRVASCSCTSRSVRPPSSG